MKITNVHNKLENYAKRLYARKMPSETLKISEIPHCSVCKANKDSSNCNLITGLQTVIKIIGDSDRKYRGRCRDTDQ